MNKIASLTSLFAATVLLCLAGFISMLTTGCEDSKSYAERLSDENKAVNRFLVDNHVIDHIPADSVFEVGEDAPYYCIDTENSIYMQVLSIGNGEKAVEDQKIYFRYMRVGLSNYNGVIYDEEWTGNANNVTAAATYFKYDNYTDQVSYQWGTGIQQPLKFVPLNSHVRLVVKSQYGPMDYMSSVVPLLWDIRYFKSQI